MSSLLEPVINNDTQQYCVEIMKRLDYLRRNEHLCDVILEVGSGDNQVRLKAHKNVLCATSPFFYNALNTEMKEKEEGVIRLKDTSKVSMEQVLEYLYTGHVDINDKNAFELMYATPKGTKYQKCNFLIQIHQFTIKIDKININLLFECVKIVEFNFNSRVFYVMYQETRFLNQDACFLNQEGRRQFLISFVSERD